MWMFADVGVVIAIDVFARRKMQLNGITQIRFQFAI